MAQDILNNIKKACRDKNITIASLEREAGLSSNSIYGWAFKCPSVFRMKSVADILGVTVDELIKEDTEAECRQEHC